MSDYHTDYECDECGGMGIVSKDVPLGHPDFGKTFPCPACTIYEDRRLANIMHVSRLDLHKDKSFDNFEVDLFYLSPTDRATLKYALSASEDYAKDFKGWLVLRGPCGVGKTHLAAAVGHEAVRKGIRTIFVTAPDFLDHLRATFAPNSGITYDQKFDQLCNIDLLILDDIGAESSTPWAQEKLYQLINYRYSAKLSTVITSNVDYSVMDQRIVSRMDDEKLARSFLIKAPDYRRAGKIGLTEVIELSNLSNYRELTFENFRPSTRELTIAYKRATAYAENPEGWIMLVGGHGSGKTHLAAAIANRLASTFSKESILMVSTADMLDFLRAAFAPDVRINLDYRFKAIRQCALLILEDFNIAERTASWSREKLFQLVDFRYMSKLPTIVTLHTDRQRWLERNHYDFHSRFSDSEFVEWVVLSSQDFRYRKGKGKNGHRHLPE